MGEGHMDSGDNSIISGADGVVGKQEGVQYGWQYCFDVPHD